jgi:putative protein-disulfide isomerase
MAAAPPSTLYYAHDPMCSWCWGFAPTWRRVRERLPAGVRVRRLLGGLAPDTETPMPAEMRRHLQATWKRIQERIPGTEFNFDFWRLCEPRRATWRACRAVIAARSQDPAAEEPMIARIQGTYYLEARNPSDAPVLGRLAAELGLDEVRFLADLDHPECQALLDEEMALCRRLGLTGFPSLALETGGGAWPVAVDYTDPSAILGPIDLLLQTGDGS